MSKPLWFRKKMLFGSQKWSDSAKFKFKKRKLLLAVALVLVPGSLFGSDSKQTQPYANAYTGNPASIIKTSSPLFENRNELFSAANLAEMQTVQANLEQIKKDKQKDLKQEKQISEAPVAVVAAKKDDKSLPPIFADDNGGSKKGGQVDEQVKIPGLKISKQKKGDSEKKSSKFAEKLYEIVGEAPIKEMVPFISQRDEKVAAFLVGIAKKESSFGSRSPLKDGQTCYNYWGYKGSGGRGTGMGYACFASAEEAIKTVGDRIEVLVGKERNTPARMVDTWKCGRSCAGDPGAPGWVSTVAIYFNQIVSSKNS